MNLIYLYIYQYISDVLIGNTGYHHCTHPDFASMPFGHWYEKHRQRICLLCGRRECQTTYSHPEWVLYMPTDEYEEIKNSLNE